MKIKLNQRKHRKNKWQLYGHKDTVDQSTDQVSLELVKCSRKSAPAHAYQYVNYSHIHTTY